MSIFGKPKQKLQPKMKDARINAEVIRNMLAMARGSQSNTIVNTEVSNMSMADSTALMAEARASGGAGGIGSMWGEERYRGRATPMEEEMFRMLKHLIRETEVMRNDIADMKEQLNALDFYKE